MIDGLLKYFSRDNVVSSLPFILSEIRNYTNQYFLTKYHEDVVKIENNVVYLKQDISNTFEVGDSVEFMNSDRNTLIYQIKNINQDKVELEQRVIDDILNKNIVMIKLSFKNVNVKTIVNMLDYSNKFSFLSGIKSQSLTGYSVTYATPSENGDGMFPIELYGGLNSLKKINDDYAEYRRKGYVRL